MCKKCSYETVLPFAKTKLHGYIKGGLACELMERFPPVMMSSSHVEKVETYQSFVSLSQIIFYHSNRGHECVNLQQDT